MARKAPQIGEIVDYMYLWHDDYKRGQRQGAKERPCLVICTLEHRRIAVLPITHTPPHEPQASIKIPARVKRRMGLEEKDGWIRCGEVNILDWENNPDLLPSSRLLRRNFNRHAAANKETIEIPDYFLTEARALFNQFVQNKTICGVPCSSSMPENSFPKPCIKPR